MSRSLLVAVLLLPWLPRGTEEKASANDKPVRIEVRLEMPEARLNHQLSLKEIRERFGRESRTKASRLIGFARLVLEARTRIETGTRSVVGGDKSLWVEAVEVHLGYREAEVFVPRDYLEGSCMYEAVLKHENEHVARDQALLEEFAERLKAALPKAHWPTQAQPLRGLSEEEGTKRFEEALEKIAKPALEDLKQKREAARAALDRGQNSEALRRRCGG